MGDVALRLTNVVPATDPEDYYSPRRYVVEADSEVTAAVTAGFWSSDGLGRFLAGLAEDFRGWSGERIWQASDLVLCVAATHEKLGHVHLRWTLTDSRHEPGCELTVRTVVDAGEDMRRLAADVRAAEPDD